MWEFIMKTVIQTGIFGIVLAGVAKYAFDKKLEAYKTEETKRQKGILIAELLAEWCSMPADKKRLNQLTWEAFIWLPKGVALRLSKCLSHTSDAPPTKQLIADVRKIILGDKEAIDAGEIIHFPM